MSKRSTIHGSHDALRPENFRIDELPPIPPETVKTVPDADPRTGRFQKGNTAAKRRKLKRVAGQLHSLDPAKCETWLRPWVEESRQHAVDIVAGLPVQTPELNAMAVEVAESRAMLRALTALGAAGDAEAREEARHWMRELRQHTLALKGLSRQEWEARQAAEAAKPTTTTLVRQDDGSWSAAPSGGLPVGATGWSPALAALLGHPPTPPPPEPVESHPEVENPPAPVPPSAPTASAVGWDPSQPWPTEGTEAPVEPSTPPKPIVH